MRIKSSALVALSVLFVTMHLLLPQISEGNTGQYVPLTINGPGEGGEGASYSVEGGTGPYAWRISCGEIDDSGTIVSTEGCCGDGTVTVSDNAGSSTIKSIRYINGKWVEVLNSFGTCNGGICRSHWAYDTLKKVYYCTNSNYPYEGYKTCTKEEGNKRITTSWGQVAGDGYYWGEYHYYDAAEGPLADCGCESYSSSETFARHNFVEEWQCEEGDFPDHDNDGVPSGEDLDDTNPDIGSEPTCTDVDDDKVCKEDDCDDTDPSIGETCPVIDSDGDGVLDNSDKCPGTPPEAYGLVDGEGCPVDTDGDGYKDYEDGCDNTPADKISLVNSKGCFVDTDQDGVPDHNDQCQDHPIVDKSFIDSVGCPLDNDQDGVDDYKDKCLDTPLGATVNSEGCKCPVVTGVTEDTTRFWSDGNGVIGLTPEVDGKVGRYEMKVNGKRFYGTGRLGKEFKKGVNRVEVRIISNGCDDAIFETEVIVEEPSPGCFKVKVASDANLASGELTDSFTLFSASGLGFALNYQSLDGNDGPLGLNWSHAYNIYLVEDDFDNVAIRQANGSWKTYQPSGYLSYLSQPGDYSTLSKDTAGIFVLTKPNGTIYTFGDNNKIATIADRNGNSLVFTYDGDNLVSVTDSNGQNITFSYAGDKLISVSDPAGNEYSLSVGDTLDSITYPDGSTWQFGYQGNAFMTSKIDPAGNLTTYHYDDQLRIVETVDPEGQSRSINYPETDDAVRTTEFIEKDGSVWLYTYNVDSGDLASKTDPEGNVIGYTYDANHNLIAKDEPGIGTSYFSYDANGNMTSSTDATGNVTEYTYNAYGQVTSITNASDETTAFLYDDQGNLVKVTDPAGNSTSYSYDDKGRLISAASATGETTSLTYDAAGNVASVTGPDGATTVFTYNANGNRTSMTDAQGNTTQYEYDAQGQLIKVIDANGQSTSYEYDANGNRSSVNDANGKTSTFEYNFEGQIVSMIDAMGYTTTFDYGGSAGCYSCGGGVDKLTKLTDAKGQSTLFKYDPLGNLIRETDPQGNVTEYGYDAANRVTSKTDPNGNTINYVYNALGRLVAKIYPDGNQTAFSYAADGNLVSAGNQHIAYEFSYDVNGRLIKVVDSLGYQIEYTYDASGNRTTLSSNAGIDIAYSYDAAGRLARIGSAAGNIDFGYDELGRRDSLIFPNGVTTTYTYDGLGRLTDLMAATGASIITENHYTHDAVGNRLSNRDARDTMSYTYDDIYRLVEAQSNTSGYSTDKGKGNTKGNSKPTDNQKEFYVYDAVGNRITSSEHKTYTYNLGNELASADDTIYTYDANGNRIAKTDSEGTTTYSWDYENRLVGVNMPDGTNATYAYDPFGRRIIKAVDGKTTRYTYDSEDILFETVDGAIGNIYIHGPGIDEPLALLGKKGSHYYHADGLGSIIALTDDQGSNVQWYDYDSYGNQHDMKNRIKQPYGYTGREHDRETRLRYYRARYYDGEVGRFISEDPIGFLAGSSNFYSYVGANPTNWIDPHGLIVDQIFNLPPFSEAYPNSDYVAPIADIVVGVVEGGIAVTAGVTTGVTFMAGPEMWWMTAPAGIVTVLSGVDSVSRITTGIDRISRSPLNQTTDCQ